MTFDQWNREETNRIVAREGADVAKLVRKARKGGIWRYMAYGDYVDYCTENNLQAEGMSV